VSVEEEYQTDALLKLDLVTYPLDTNVVAARAMVLRENRRKSLNVLLNEQLDMPEARKKIKAKTRAPKQVPQGARRPGLPKKSVLKVDEPAGPLDGVQAAETEPEMSERKTGEDLTLVIDDSHKQETEKAIPSPRLTELISDGN
jgi:hypothetical protein